MKNVRVIKNLIALVLCSAMTMHIANISAQTNSSSFSISSDSTNSSTLSITENSAAGDNSTLTEQESPESATDNKKEQKKIVNEVKDMWEENVRQYKNEDGSYVAVAYAEPVNYLKDGQWTEIDNTLILVTDKGLGDVYQNRGNSYKATFSKTAGTDGLVTMEKDKHSIAWSLDSTKNPGKSNSEAEILNYDNQETGLSDNEKLMEVGKSSSAIIYKSVFTDIDLKYTVAPEKIKEDIILNKPSSVESFVFNISAPGLEVKINDDKSISFVNPDKPYEMVFSIPAPYMTDSSEEQATSYDVIMALSETKSGHELTIIPDLKWINAPERVLPIYIDPTISSSQLQTDIVDTYVHVGDTAGEHNLSTILSVGTKSGEICRSLVKTLIPTLPNVNVIDARLNLSMTGGTSTWQNLDVYRINSTWSSSTMTWAIQNTISKTLVKSNVVGTSYSNSPSYLRYSCDVTGTIQDIYEGSLTNYGFMFKYTNESIPDYNYFYSSDYATSTVRPTLVVTYTYAQTPGITNNKVYYIRNKHSGKYLDVTGAGTGNGTDAIQWHFTGATNQQWKTIYMGNGTYKLMAMNTTDKYLEVEFNNNNNGTILDIFGGDYTEQYWYIMKNPSASSYRILSKCSNYTKGATVEGASSGDGATIFQYTYTIAEEDNDDWYFEEINSILFPKISSLHQCAKTYNSDFETSNMLLFQFLRSSNPAYTTSNFIEVAGEIDQSFISYVNTSNSELNFLRQFLIETSDVEYGPVDFTHLAATTNAILYDSTSFRTLIVGEQKVNDLSGWAGDLQTLVIDTIEATNNSNNYTTFYDEFLSLLGSESASFGMKDILADLDAKYLAENITTSLFGNQLTNYYSATYQDRFSNFIESRTLDQLKSAVYIYTYNYWVWPIAWPLYSGYTVTTTQAQAARDAFADFIWARQ